MAFITPQFLSPASMVSVRNTWDHDSPFGMHTRNKMSVKAKASKTNDKMHVVHLHIQTAGHCGLVTLMALAQPSILDISKRNLRRKMNDGMTCIETWFKREQGVGWGGGGGIWGGDLRESCTICQTCFPTQNSSGSNSKADSRQSKIKGGTGCSE